MTHAHRPGGRARGIVKTWCATNAGGRDEYVIVGDGGAVQPMKVGPSESPCGGRLQTASCCAGREAGVVSDEEKAPVRRQVGTRKANVSESLWTCRDDKPHDIETGVSGCSRDEPGGCPLIGQVVSGMKATRAWSAAAARNVGRPTLILPPRLGW